MATTEHDEWRTRKRAIYQNLRDRPLDYANEADHALYQAVHDPEHDPVQRLFNLIDTGRDQSVQLVAGFRGVGKTTELSRLETLLWKAGYLVARIDLKDHLDLHSPIDVRDFLLILTGAMSEALLDERLLDRETALKLNFWHRAKDFLAGLADTEVMLRDSSGTLNWKVLITENHEFRDQVRRTLGAKLPLLEREVHAFVGAVVEALRVRHGPGRPFVLIVDSLEHIRGTPDKVRAVHESVRELFLTHGKRLVFPDVHMVFSVPAFMALKADNVTAEFVNGAVQAWAAFHVWHRDDKGDLAVDEATMGRLIALVEKRIDWRLLLRDEAALRELILASGGYARDLLNLLIEALFQTGADGTRAEPSKVIARVRRNYLPLYSDEVALLRAVARERAVRPLNSSERESLAGFLDSHVILCYLNDDFWYDVHPLVKGELA